MFWLMDLLKSLVDTVVTLVNFVISLIAGLINLVVKIPIYLDVIISSINFLPAFVIPFATASLMIIIVQYVVNRKSG